MSPIEKVLTYTVIFDHAEEGGYIAFVPKLPGCMSQGETIEEAKRNIREAIQGYVAVLKEDGDDVPVESSEQFTAMVTVPMMA